MLFSALLLLSSLVSGAVLKSEGQGCTSVIPSFVGIINSALPDTVTENGPPGCSEKGHRLLSEPGVTAVYKDTSESASKDIYVDAVIEFANIPSTAWGCQLEVKFTPGYTRILFYDHTPINLDVWSADKTVGDGHALTWNNAPKPHQLIGTVTGIDLPRPGKDIFAWPAYDVAQSHVVVNSMKCKEKMTFRVKVPEEVTHGGVEFKQEEKPFGGWTLKYNC